MVKNGFFRVHYFDALLTLCLLSACLMPTTAVAAAESDILSQARISIAAGVAMERVCTEAVASIRSAGGSMEGTSAALAQNLLLEGMKSGRDGIISAQEIMEGLLSAYLTQQVPTQELFRTVSNSVLGLRAGAARAGLDQAALRAAIEQSLTRIALSGDLATQLAAVIAAAFAKDVAETYTFSFAPRPPAPTGSPTRVSGRYDGTVSPSQ